MPLNQSVLHFFHNQAQVILCKVQNPRRSGYKMIVFSRLIFQSIRHWTERSKAYRILHPLIRMITLCYDSWAVRSDIASIIFLLSYMVYHKLFRVFDIRKLSFIVYRTDDINSIKIERIACFSLIDIYNMVRVVYSESENIKKHK